jgi:triacylglycerol lipase
MKKWIAAAALAAGALGAAVLPTAARADSYTQTRYPIVLVHGLFGWDAIGPFDYWWGIGSALRSGGATVYVTQQSAANASEVRGEQLLAELKRLKAAYGHQRFNLVGHSHGGHTIRYVAAVAPELVASVTSVGSPHAGSPVADDIAAALDGTGSTAFAAKIFDAMGAVISTLAGGASLPQSSEAAMRSLSSAGSAAFTQKFPQGKPSSNCGEGAYTVNGVRYYSIGGSAVLTNLLDPVDGLLVLGSASFKGGDNDGLVGRCSSHWGQVLRDDYPWNHLDEVNQAFGLRGLFTPDPVSFYRSHANRLKGLGL